MAEGRKKKRRPPRLRRFFRRRFSVGRLGRRSIGGKWTPGRPFGRGEIVSEFHRVRKLDHPPIFVIQGVRGYQKSELLDHLRHTFTQRRSWHKAEEVDAKVDFFAISPEPESAFASINSQLKQKSSWIRRLRTPRFRRLQVLLARERHRRGVPPMQVSGTDADLGWVTATAGVRIAAAALKVPLPMPDRDNAVIGALRDAWWRVALTRAARWVRRYLRDLPDEMDAPGSLRERHRILQEGLAAATAEDLRIATRRRLLPIGEVVLFVDGYHHVERSARPSFIADFAGLLANSKARVLMVIASRDQERWSKLADAQDDCRDFPTMRISGRIQIHRLQPLSPVDSHFVLYKHGVPASLVSELARLSAGVPIALNLLGTAFGEGEVGDDRVQTLLDKLPDSTNADEEWFNLFSRTIAEEIVDDLDTELVRHLRAAATQRNFDRQLMQKLLGQQFSGRCFEKLVGSDLVGTPRPSVVLGVERSYRVRSFVREIFATDTTESEAVAGWHRGAEDYLSRRAEQAITEETAFQLRAETLYHRLFREPEAAKVELFQSFQAELLSSRTDRCEVLLWVALEYDWTDPHWRATVLANAGKMYLARDRHQLAQERLLEAKRWVSLDDAEPRLAVTISLALAKSYRLGERSLEARKELALLCDRERVHPVVRFQCLWSECLEAKDAGTLSYARRRTGEARELLEELLDGPDARSRIRAAETFGLGPLARKRAHIVRHEADLARREGNYIVSLEKVEEALALYALDPEDGIEGYTELIRAHVLRQVGDFDASLELARGIYRDFMESRPRDLQGAGWALRCMAQAQLCGPDPAAALPTLEEIVDMDPLIYPRGNRFGLFGKAELLRHEEKNPQARRLYDRSEQGANDHLANFERCYAQLGRIELDRGEVENMVDREISLLEAQAGLSEHPVLAFYVALLKVRHLGRLGEHVEDAERAALRIVHPPKRESLEMRALKLTTDAIETGAEPPPLVLNLP